MTASTVGLYIEGKPEPPLGKPLKHESGNGRSDLSNRYGQ